HVPVAEPRHLAEERLRPGCRWPRLVEDRDAAARLEMNVFVFPGKSRPEGTGVQDAHMVEVHQIFGDELPVACEIEFESVPEPARVGPETPEVLFPLSDVFAQRWCHRVERDEDTAPPSVEAQRSHP